MSCPCGRRTRPRSRSAPGPARPQAPQDPDAPDPERDRRQLRDHVHELEHHEQPYDHSAHDTRTMKVALAGNPNCGKTTLFNALTGSNQYVGNWPGVTVEKKEGTAHLGDRAITVVDLPGIYSLSPYSMEEIVARDFIIGEGPDAVIDIVDATNLERNLYLTVQLLELERPLVLALNFMDEVKARGDQIDVERLSKELGVPVVPITAKTGEGLDELSRWPTGRCTWGSPMSPTTCTTTSPTTSTTAWGSCIHDYAYAANLPAHWASIKLLEGDDIVAKALNLPAEVQKKLDAIIAEYEASSDLGDRETLVADSRYRYIERVVHASVVKGQGVGGPHPHREDRPDRHRQVHRPPPVPVRHAGDVRHHLRPLRLLASGRGERPHRPVLRLAGGDPHRGRGPRRAGQPGCATASSPAWAACCPSCPRSPCCSSSCPSWRTRATCPGRPSSWTGCCGASA